VLAGSAAAQTPEHAQDALAPGRQALAFSLPNGGAVGLGKWKVVAPDRLHGLFLSLYARTSVDRGWSGQPGSELRQTDVRATLGPHFRRYVARSGPVLPFVESAVEVGVAYSRLHEQEPNVVYYSNGQQGHELSALGSLGTGIGAEWFPLPRVSVSGQVGLRLDGSVGKSSFEPGSMTVWSVNLTTFTPGLFVQLYF
jgi:hypothetical protein